MPKISRPPPPYVQIANHYRDRIVSGEFQPGVQLPALSEIERTWKVSHATAVKAIGLLQVEGAVYTTNQGSFVADKERVSPTPADRLRVAPPRRAGDPADVIMVTGAGSVPAPVYVAELLGITPSELVIRREEVTNRHARPLMLSVDWIPAHGGVMEAAELTAAEPVAGGLAGVVERTTGHQITHGRDYIEGRTADQREADALHLPVGAAILAGTHIWSAADGEVMIYGEWVMPAGQVISYEYVPGPDAAAEE